MTIEQHRETKTKRRFPILVVAAFAAIAILAAAPLAIMSLTPQAAYGAGVIIEAKPQADPKDADADGAVFAGVIIEGPVKAVQGPTLIVNEPEDIDVDSPPVHVQRPQITNVDEGDDDTGECNPDDDVGVC